MIGKKNYFSIVMVIVIVSPNLIIYNGPPVKTGQIWTDLYHDDDPFVVPDTFTYEVVGVKGWSVRVKYTLSSHKNMKPRLTTDKKAWFWFRELKKDVDE